MAMKVMWTYLLDGLDVSQIDDLLHLKVVVFIQAQEVNLLSISTDKKQHNIYKKKMHQTSVPNWILFQNTTVLELII